VSQTPSPPAGWYPDPSGDADRDRWWDGGAWTSRERLAAAPAFAPPVAPTPQATTTATGGAGSAADALPKAAWLSRLSATVIDALLVGVAALSVDLLLSELGTRSVNTPTFAYLTLALLYPPTALALNHGRTWGKQAVGIRVVREDAGEVGFGMAFARESLVKGIFALFTFVYVIDGLFPLWDGRRRALHDMMLGTRVVRDDTGR
jgi:uncharacterized RDD family membrane protein YckC